MQRTESFKGSSLFLVGAAHTLSNVKYIGFDMQEAYPAFKYMCTDSSIAVAPKNVIDEHGAFLNNRRTPTTPDFGVWVKGKQGSKEGTFLAHGSEGIMKDIWQHNRKDTNEVNRPICP